MVIKMLKNLRERMGDLSKSVNKEIVSIKKDIEMIKKKKAQVRNEEYSI